MNLLCISAESEVELNAEWSRGILQESWFYDVYEVNVQKEVAQFWVMQKPLTSLLNKTRCEYPAGIWSFTQ